MVEVASFILGGGGKAVSGLSKVLRYGGTMQMLRNPRIPYTTLSLVGLLQGFGNKVKLDQDGNPKPVSALRKFAQRSANVLQKPGEFFEKTPGDLLETPVIPGKYLDGDAAKLIGKGQEQARGFGRTVSTHIGSLATQMDKTFNLSGKTEKQIAASKDKLRELRSAFTDPVNKLTGLAKLKDKVAKQKADLTPQNQIINQLSRTGLASIEQAFAKQRDLEALSPSQRRSIVNQAKQLNEDFSNKLKEATAGVKDKQQLAEARDKVFKSFGDKDRELLTKAEMIQNPQLHYADEARGKLFGDLNRLDGTVADSVRSGVNRYVDERKELDRLERRKQFWENPAEQVLERARNVKLSEVLDYGIRYGEVLHEGAHNLHQAKIGIRTIKQLMADLSGKNPKNISTFTALFGSGVSPVVKEARRQFWKTMLPQNIIFGTTTVLQEVGARKLKRKFGSDHMLTTIGVPIAYQALQGLGQLFGGHNNIMLQQYANMRITQEAGEPLGAQDYASLLTAASKDIKAIGGTANYNTTLIARYYASNNTPVAEVMKDINAGKEMLMQRSQQGAEAMKEYYAAQQAQEASQLPQPQAETGLVKGKFTAQERNQPKGGVGSHAQQVLNSPSSTSVGNNL